MPLGRLHRLVGVEQGQLDVVERRRSREQIESLKHEADLVVAHLGKLVAAELGDVAPVEKILAAGRVIETAENVHQRGLARPGWPGCRDELSRLDVERHPAKGVHLHFADVVGLDEVANGDDRHYCTSATAPVAAAAAEATALAPAAQARERSRRPVA